MTQFLAIVRWELKFYVRRISTWVYFGLFVAIAFFFVLVAGGGLADASLSLGSGGKVLANSPFSLSSLIPIISLLGVSITAALAGNALYKDYESHSDPLFYTTPVSKGVFLGGRFVGTLVINAMITTGIAVGAFAATVSPWVHADKIAPFSLMSYVHPYVSLVLPNLVLTAAIFFALVSLTRQMLPNYVGGATLLIGYLLAGSLIGDMEDKHLAALVDPFGMRAQGLLTEYWSIAEKNSRQVPLAGVLVENRLLWLAVAAAVFALAYARFKFAHRLGDAARQPAPGAPAPGDGSAEALAPEPVLTPLRLSALPATVQRFDRAARWTQFRSVFARSFWRIVTNRYFGVIVGGGLLYLLVAARAAGRIFGTTTWPVTYQMESLLSGQFGIFIIVIIAFYSGELIWAERDVKLNQIYDATPITNGVVFFAKFAALASVVLALLGVTMIAGIGMQAFRGYYRFEIPLYLESLVGFRFVDFLLIAALAMTIHVLVNHKYLGHFLVIVLYIGIGLVGNLTEHNLYEYASDSGYMYSDMNGWGPFVWPFFWWKVYWGAFAVLLLVLAYLFWVRGEETTLGARSRLARLRFRRPAAVTAGSAGLVFVGVGAFIFYNTNVLNVYRSSKAERHLRAERERLYKKYEHVPQPRITGVTIQADLYPSAGNAIITGQYMLVNKTPSPVDSIHLGVNEDVEIRHLDFAGAGTRVLDDRPRNYLIYRLATPLLPGDSIAMHFTLAKIRHGFPNHITDNAVAGNGTFLENAAFMPTIGYDPRDELTEDDPRKKEHLPARPRMRPPTDSSTWASNYISHDADWLSYDATVSTDEDQLAMTSGYLQKDWIADGRHYYHYEMDAPILNLWAFQSARYAVKRDKWHDVDISILYHPTHAYNVDRMIDAVKKSLDYYTANFGPYQYHQLRIVEFPRYASFAQSLPNTIPFSEAIGFIARVASPADVDYPFYVTAHEVAHQWWAHQVIGADAQGSTILSETMAQYSALMVMEHEFGAANMRKFLEYELDGYLTGRGIERHREMPLELVENQPYIHYNKGALVTYAMRDYLGEQRMNKAVQGFLNATKFRGPPYPTSLEFVDSLRAATPDSLKYLITDLFETITLDELRTDSVNVRDAAGGKFSVDLFVTAKKMRADSLGRETEVPMHDWIDIGLFTKAPAKPDPKIDEKVGVPIYLQKHLIHSGAQQITVLTDAKPYRAGIDPLHKLIDRITGDNTVGVRDRTARTATPRR